MKKMTIMVGLQHFAGVAPDLNTNSTTSTGVTNEMKTFYDKNLLDNAEPELVFNRFGQVRDIPANSGKKIEFRRFDMFPKATQPITDGVTPKGRDLSVSKVEAVVQQYGDYTTISDQLDGTAIDPVVVEVTALHGSQAGRTLEAVTRDKLLTGTNVYYANGKTRSTMTNADTITADDVFSLAAQLKAANAQPEDGGEYIMIVHPYVAKDLMSSATKTSEWISVQQYADPSKIVKGEIGSLAGIRFIESSESKVYYDTADGCAAKTAVFACVVFGANAYGRTSVEGMGLQTIIKGLGQGEDPLNQRSTVGWKAMHTAEILTGEWLIRYECGSSKGGSVTAAN